MRRLVVMLALLGCRPVAPAVASEAPRAPMVASTTPRAPEPEPENAAVDLDADGVPDPKDRCPDEPEDPDGFEDDDGCADRDNDQDKILDAFEFKDGHWTNCDRMNDDGVEVDCRNRPEDHDGMEDLDGCPDLLPLDHCQVPVPKPLQFDRNGEFIDDIGVPLDELANIMRLAPKVTMYVFGHVDRRKDRVAARGLSQRLADEVVEEMVRRGIERERFEAAGQGDEEPADRRGTAAARAKNRRVEIKMKECNPRPKRPPGFGEKLECI